MKLLTLVILLIAFANTYSLSCLTTDDGQPFSMNTFFSDSDDIMEEVEPFLSPMDIDNGVVCRVKLYFDYDTQTLNITFTAQLQDSNLVDQDVQIDIQVKGNQTNNIHIENYLEYACSEDECELDFLREYVEWFMDVDRPELPDRLASWILGDNQESGNCLYSDGTVAGCSSKQCVADVEMNDNEEFVLEPFCGADNYRKKTGLYFTMKFDLNFGYNLLSYQFRCAYDNCNNKTIVDKVIEIFHEEYNILSITKVFGFDSKNEEDTTTPSVNPSSPQQQTNSVTSTSITNFSKSTTITSSITNSYINNTVTTIGGTTTELNNGLRRQNTNAIIYVALFILITYWPFLA